MLYMLVRTHAACFCMIVYTYFYFHSKKRLQVMTSYVFECCILAGAIHALGAAGTEYTVNFRNALPMWANHSLHTIYMLSLLIFCVLMLYYYYLYFERALLINLNRRKVILLVVALAAMLAVASLPITYVDTPKGAYCSGWKVRALNVTMLYVFLSLVEMLVRYHAVLRERRDWVMLGGVIVLISTAAVQLAMPYVMITSLTLTLLLITTMVSAEDAHAYTDFDTNMYNEQGMREIIKELMLTGEAFPLGVYTFVGEDMAILRAMRSIYAKLPAQRRKDFVCATPYGDMMLVLPLRRFSGLGRMPDPLPVPDVPEGSGMQYAMTTLRIEPGTKMDEIRDKVLEFKSQFTESQLMRDELTGLLRRAAFMRRVAQVLEESQPFAFVMLDLDNFKGVNDHYGHSVGDKVLKGVAEAFSSALRAGDLVCRIGGDEFAAVLPGMADSEVMDDIANRVQRRLDEMELVPDSERDVRISMGTKIYPEGHEPVRFEEAYDAADAALYQSKRAGRSKIHVCLDGRLRSVGA